MLWNNQQVDFDEGQKQAILKVGRIWAQIALLKFLEKKKTIVQLTDFY